MLSNKLRRAFPLLLITLLLWAHAQSQGVHFEDDLSWPALQAKAKAENKYIFIDFYTTWCGPCRFMKQTIFPQKEAGDFFNDKFICTSVQLDTTNRDNDQVRSWYADAHALVDEYNIHAYPTFLIFSPDGRPLHRVVGSRTTVAAFVKLVSDGLDPAKQYYPLVEQFRNGRRDSAFVRRLAILAHNLYDNATGREAMRAYFAVSNDPFARGPLELLLRYTEHTTDSSFAFVMANVSYAGILYKLGKKDEALTFEQKAIDAAAPQAKYQYVDRLALMQKGEKTWD